MASFLSRVYDRAVQAIKKSSALEIYTDGSSKKGIGSWAFVISQPGKRLIESSGCVRRAGSNVMEFRAAIEALSSIPLSSKVTLFSDSRILIDAMKSGDGPVVYRAQIEILMRLTENRTVAWRWIKGHNANILNERCDELCTLARSPKEVKHGGTTP